MQIDATEPSATPPPPENKRRRGAALPILGDVTNLLPATPTNPTNTRRPRPLPSDTTASATAPPSATLTPISKPPSAAAISAQSATARSLVKSPISTVYTRSNRNTITTDKRKRKNPANNNTPFPHGTASCPLPTRTNRKTSVDQDTRPISSSAPCHQAKKKQNTRVNITSSGKSILPEDFVKKQRAYFQEIDAFELPEEEASETDLE
uniref:Sororin C-terminal region domain-containing protein n=1 Tax=Leersia perrieri TaxID=77586 RepID=A0A0D9XNA5_9ORYZ